LFGSPRGAPRAPHHRRWLEAAGIEAIGEPVVRLRGSQDAISGIEFSGGRSTPCDALFVIAPLHQDSRLASKLGCKIDRDGRIVADVCGRTTVPGCYAAGDAVTQRHQLVIAAASGTQAAMGINDALVDREAAQLCGTAAP
jgi:thioredoxin reductase